MCWASPSSSRFACCSASSVRCGDVPRTRCARARSAFTLSCSSPSTCTGKATPSIVSPGRSFPNGYRTRRHAAVRSARPAGRSRTSSPTKRRGASTGPRSTRTCRSAISSLLDRPRMAARGISPFPAYRCSIQRDASSATAGSAATSPSASASRLNCARGKTCWTLHRKRHARSPSIGTSALARARTAGRPSSRRCMDSSRARSMERFKAGRSSSIPTTGRRQSSRSSARTYRATSRPSIG